MPPMSAKSESIWIGLCVILLALLAVVAGMAWVNRERLINEWFRMATETDRLQQCVDELEDENNKLRADLEAATEDPQ